MSPCVDEVVNGNIMGTCGSELLKLLKIILLASIFLISLNSTLILQLDGVLGAKG